MDNENVSQVKLTWFDKIFKPQVITLPNGHSTIRRRSRAPIIIALVLLAIVLSLRMTGFDLSIVVKKFDKLLDLMVKLFHPKWSFFGKVVRPLIDTIKMSILGTVIGCLLALPVSVLASTNIEMNVRASAILGYVGAGGLGITINERIGWRDYEGIETIDMGPFEAMEAMGANKFQAFWSACVPQILPVYLSHSLYCFEMNVRASAILGYVGAGGLGITIEMNVRASAILGYVGAGGLGITINERIGWRDYEGLGMVLLTLFVVVVIIEFTSEYLRGRLS